MAVDPELYVKLVLLGILHWVLAVILLYDLADRKRVLGGRTPLSVVRLHSGRTKEAILYSPKGESSYLVGA